MRTRLFITAIAGLSVLTLGAAEAEPFTLLIFETPAQISLREAKTPEGAAYWEAWSAAAKAMADAGVVTGGSALSTGTEIVRVGAADPAATGIADGQLLLGGYFQIEAPNLDSALTWARKLPVGDGMVEVRAGYPVPGGM